MKKSIVVSLMCFAAISSAFGQEFKKPSEGKSLVYFVRSSGTGALINFKYFDGEKYLGKMNGIHYFTYECDPGNHIFWAAAENRDFISGELKPNETYVIEVRPTMGAVKAAVRLHQISPDDEKSLKKAYKVMAKKPATELKGLDEDMAFFIKNGMERFEKTQSESKKIESDWTF